MKSWVLAGVMSLGVCKAATLFYQDFSDGGVPADYVSGGSAGDTLFDGIGDADGGGAGTGYTQSISSGRLKLDADPIESGAQGFKYNHSSTVTHSTFDLTINFDRTNSDYDWGPGASFFFGAGSTITADFDQGAVAAQMFLDVTVRVTGSDYQIENSYNNESPDIELGYGNDVDLRFVFNDGTEGLVYRGPNGAAYLLDDRRLGMFYNHNGGGWTMGWDNELGRGYYLGNTPDMQGFRFMEHSENWTSTFDDLNWVDTIDQTSNRIWTQNGSGTWNVDTNWVSTHPDASQLVAEFGDNGGLITANPTVTLTGSRRVGGVLIEDQDYTFTGGTILLDNGASETAVMLIQNGSTATISSNVTLESDAEIYQDSTNTMTISGVIADGTNGDDFEKSGSGALLLSGTSANTFTGNVLVSGGSLLLGKTAGVNAIGALAAGKTIQVDSGATLELAADNQIENTNTLVLNGGTFDTGGFDETFTNLTLSANSVIDMSGGNSVITATGTISGLNSYTLSIWNWDGNPLGGGNDQLIFSGDTLTDTELYNIRFYRDNGVTPYFQHVLNRARQLNTGEVVPAPEASTWLSGIGLLVLAFWRLRKSVRRNADAQVARAAA